MTVWAKWPKLFAQARVADQEGRGFMFGGWTATVALTGVAEFTRYDAASFRTATQSRLRALSRATNLRHADDQSVAALAALLNAIGDEDPDVFREWATVAAPRLPGHAAMSGAIERYAVDGAWGVSPQIIPNYLLHSTSGLLSVVLGMSGPNIGAGGLPGREFEAFLSAIPFLDDGTTPGTWIVIAGWNGDVCRAVAVGLRRSASGKQNSSRRPHIELCRGSFERETAELLTLESLFTFVTSAEPADSHWSLPDGSSLKWHAATSVEAAA